MIDSIINNEAILRLAFFLGTLLIMVMWEVLAPRRHPSQSRWIHWSNNLGLVVLNSVLLRLVFPAAAVGMAITAQNQGWGILPTLGLAQWLNVLLAILLLDFFIWLQHVMVHAIPVLWRIHRVHHADLDYDVTTGLRFHPIEIFLSMGIKFAVIAMLGPPILAVIIFEIILNVSSMFNHGNVRLPIAFDRVLRIFVVTPDMHRVHHSIYANETNSNFGFFFSWWDRLFGTYIDQPRDGHETMTVGIDTFRNKRDCTWLSGILMIPFKGGNRGYALNRRFEKQDDE